MQHHCEIAEGYRTSKEGDGEKRGLTYRTGSSLGWKTERATAARASPWHLKGLFIAVSGTNGAVVGEGHSEGFVEYPVWV